MSQKFFFVLRAKSKLFMDGCILQLFFGLCYALICCLVNTAYDKDDDDTIARQIECLQNEDQRTLNNSNRIVKALKVPRPAAAKTSNLHQQKSNVPPPSTSLQSLDVPPSYEEWFRMKSKNDFTVHGCD